ncbi:MAG: sulfotransferase [Pirellulaceae bacterium]|nr:sulfotransferase [Pirellulaceae bacterium]
MDAAGAEPQSLANQYSLHSPRFWHGMKTEIWWRLVAANGFRIYPRRSHIALGVSTIGPINNLLAAVQHWRYGARIQATGIEQPPIFILGHWRSGTTLLHELLVSNPDFASPTTYQCFAPSHFLISSWVARFGGFLIPAKRPMDNMAAGWYLPQEDEFALMNLGLPSPYLRIAFPQTQRLHLEYLDMVGLTDGELNRWQSGLEWFLKAVTVANDGRRLVLKSPTHTGRIALLHKMFPGARFIHLTRDPRQLYASTMRLWWSLDQVQSLQNSYTHPEMKRYVKLCIDRMYGGHWAGRSQVPDTHLIDVRYEDLVASPLETLREIYSRLGLGDFQPVAASAENLMAGYKDYQTNRHRTDSAWEREVMELCADYAQRYGY